MYHEDFYVHSLYFYPFLLHLPVSCYSNPSRGRLVFNWSTNAFSCTLNTKLPLFPGHILGTGIYIKAFAVARTDHYKQFLLFFLWQQMWCKHWLLKATILPHQGIIIILMLVGNIISLAGTFSKQSVIWGMLINSCITNESNPQDSVTIRPPYHYMLFNISGHKQKNTNKKQATEWEGGNIRRNAFQWHLTVL